MDLTADIPLTFGDAQLFVTAAMVSRNYGTDRPFFHGLSRYLAQAHTCRPAVSNSRAAMVTSHPVFESLIVVC